MTTNIDTLRKQRGAKHDELKAIHAKAEAENRDLNETEAAAWKDGTAALKALDARIERALVVEGNEARQAKAVEAPVRPGIPKFFPVSRLKAFRNGTDDERREAAYRSGMFLAAAVFGKSWAKAWCAENGIPLSLEKWEEQKAMSEGSNTAGGFLVPGEFESAIIDLREMYGVFRQSTRVHNMASDTTTVPRRAGGLTAYAVGEGVAGTYSDKAWNQVSLTARKWMVLAKYSSELNQDAIISMADDLAAEIAYAFATTEDDCGWNGDGSPTYHGIRGTRVKLLTLAGAVVAASGHDTFAEIDAADLSSVMAKLPAYALPGAKWYISQPGKTLLFDRLTQAAGGNTKQDFGGKAVDSYQGYPIVVSQKLPLVATDISDTIMLHFGDLTKSTTLGDRRGILIASSEHVAFESDQLVIRGTTRFDINNHDLGDATNAGPLVGLEAE